MGAELSTCPSPRTLERLLAEQLTGPERDSVDTHVETCASCQGQLEGLLATALRQVTPPARPPGPRPEPDEALLSRLRELPPPRAGNPEAAPPPAAEFDTNWGGAAWLADGCLGQYEV